MRRLILHLMVIIVVVTIATTGASIAASRAGIQILYVLIASIPVSAILAFVYTKRHRGRRTAFASALLSAVIVFYSSMGLYIFLARPCC
jgi:hypothetical protein